MSLGRVSCRRWTFCCISDLATAPGTRAMRSACPSSMRRRPAGCSRDGNSLATGHMTRKRGRRGLTNTITTSILRFPGEGMCSAAWKVVRGYSALTTAAISYIFLLKIRELSTWFRKLHTCVPDVDYSWSIVYSGVRRAQLSSLYSCFFMNDTSFEANSHSLIHYS
jgi:hypothetical protein